MPIRAALMTSAPAPVRRWVWAEVGDNWSKVAARYFPGKPETEIVKSLKKWNGQLVYTPNWPPSAVIFLEGKSDA